MCCLISDGIKAEQQVVSKYWFVMNPFTSLDNPPILFPVVHYLRIYFSAFLTSV